MNIVQNTNYVLTYENIKFEYDLTENVLKITGISKEQVKKIICEFNKDIFAQLAPSEITVAPAYHREGINDKYLVNYNGVYYKCKTISHICKCTGLSINKVFRIINGRCKIPITNITINKL